MPQLVHLQRQRTNPAEESNLLAVSEKLVVAEDSSDFIYIVFMLVYSLTLICSGEKRNEKRNEKRSFTAEKRNFAVSKKDLSKTDLVGYVQST